MAFVKFAAVKKAELFRIVNVPAWKGQIRLNKLSARELMPIVALQEDFSKDDKGNLLDDAEAIQFSIHLLSKMIADESGKLQFDSDKGRKQLEYEFAAITGITADATDLCGLSEDTKKKEMGK